ncbi:lipoprotein [Citrobacter freundii]|uniref:lipoprotein n=1 Tax=Citrobacter portucalensis TaxID=1639133 RepID=UPI0013FDC05B|nr:lipoprotein [Citrobacter portucalensis]UKK33198.1 lipoprotein [Citrobacter freundii]
MKKTIIFIALTALLSGCSADFAQRYADAKREQDRRGWLVIPKEELTGRLMSL